MCFWELQWMFWNICRRFVIGTSRGTAIVKAVLGRPQDKYFAQIEITCKEWVLAELAIFEARHVGGGMQNRRWWECWTKFIAGRSLNDELGCEFEDSEDELLAAIQFLETSVCGDVPASGQLHSLAFLTLPCEMMRNGAVLSRNCPHLALYYYILYNYCIPETFGLYDTEFQQL